MKGSKLYSSFDAGVAVRALVFCLVLSTPGVAQDASSKDPLLPGKQSGENYPEYHELNHDYDYSTGGDESGSSDDYKYDYLASDRLGKVYKPEYSDEGQYRQPVSIVVLDSDSALVCSKLTGEIFEVSLGDEVPEQRLKLAFQSSGAAWGRLEKLTEQVVALTEHANDQVVILRRAEGNWQEVCRLSAPGKPNSLKWDPVSNRLFASAVWGQRLYVWQKGDSFNKWSDRSDVDLPMCGGQVLLLPKRQLVLVVDAFARHYVFASLDDLQIVKHAELYGHNVSDLAVTDDEELIFFPHQLLNEYARSVTTNITWGGLMSNNLRWLKTDRMLHQEGVEIFKLGKFHPLGTPGNGAGDPSSMDVSSRGQIAVTLAGTGRVAIEGDDGYYFQIGVGLRPVDCAFTDDGSKLLVVNQFSDSVSVIDVDEKTVEHWPLGKLRQPNQVELGEQLFFNSRLAHDAWMSCHSCHSHGHTNGQLNDNFSDKSYGTPKRVLSLLGQAHTMPYAWGGGVGSLEEQVANSVVSTMAGRPLAKSQVHAVAAYIRQLPNPPSLNQMRSRESVTDGRQSSKSPIAAHPGKLVFDRLGCADCHSGEHLTSTEVFDVGLEDESQMREFNPPSLVGVSQRQNALLHDGRANSLRDVVALERHQVSEAISPTDLEALVQYLQSLYALDSDKTTLTLQQVAVVGSEFV